MANFIGQRISNYEITGVLGKGGMAVVYRARQLNIQREVAIKIIKPELTGTDDLIKRFERETNIVASLSHPHILKLFDFGQHDEMLYIVMELLPGGTLADAIREKPISPEHAARLLDQIADALDYAHTQGLIHRDLKPQNILLDQRGNAHLTDFGIAKMLTQDTGFTQTGVAMGTPAYMPPEQWQGKTLDARADVYALGVLLYEMLTGYVPFRADTPASFMYRHLQDKPPSIHTTKSGLPRDVDMVIQKALAKTPEERFASATEMAVAFREALDSVDPNEVEAATVIDAMPQAPTKQVKSRISLPVLIAAGLVTLVAGGFLVTRLLPNSVPPTPTIELTSATQTATQAVAVEPSSTSAPTVTPTLDTTAAAQEAAQRTNAAAATINAARTQLFIDDLTEAAKQATAVPTNTVTSTATPTASPTVPTLTPSITFTPTLISTPTIPIWDNFRSESYSATLWETSQWANGTTTQEIVNGVLRLETNGGQTRYIRGTRIREMAALVTLQTDGAAFNLVINGAGANDTGRTYRFGFTCNGTTLDRVVGRPGQVFHSQSGTMNRLFSQRGCPQTHLLLIKIDGTKIHFSVDDDAIMVHDIVGDAKSAGFDIRVERGAKTKGVILIHSVWVKFGY